MHITIQCVCLEYKEDPKGWKEINTYGARKKLIFENKLLFSKWKFKIVFATRKLIVPYALVRFVKKQK